MHTYLFIFTICLRTGEVADVKNETDKTDNSTGIRNVHITRRPRKVFSDFDGGRAIASTDSECR